MNRHIKALEIMHSGTVIPATPLVLDSGGKLDEKRQRALIRYYLEAGAGGIATAVHTTQFAIRRPDIGLFEPVLRVVADEISRIEDQKGGAVVRIAGVCGPLEQALKEAENARTLGYDAVLLSPGGLGYLDEQALLTRARRVAEIVPVIGFYLQPSVGGRLFSYRFWEEFCEIENVVAIKCAPFNRYMTLDTVRAAALSGRADKIALYTGNDDNIVIDLLTTYRFEKNGKTVEKRFVGGLLGHWSIWTHTVVDLYHKIRAAAQKEAVPADLITMAAEITDANAAVFDPSHGFAGCIPGIHEVLRRQGLIESIRCLDLNETLSPGQAEEIDRVYRMYPHLNDDAFVRRHLKEWLAAE